MPQTTPCHDNIRLPGKALYKNSYKIHRFPDSPAYSEAYRHDV